MPQRVTYIRCLKDKLCERWLIELAGDYGPSALTCLHLYKQAAGAIGREADALTGADSLGGLARTGLA